MSCLQITTKIGCSNACTYCPQETLINTYRKRSSNYLLSIDRFRTCIDKLPTKVDVWFAGMCEPWLNSECTDMLLYAHRKGHKISVFTALTGMKLSDFDLLESIPFGFFKVHLPSDDGQENFQISDDYFTLLDKILKSSITATFHCHGKNPNSRVKLLLANNKAEFEFRSQYQRSGNIKIKSRLNIARKRGVIGCSRDLRCNVLLPNGDVLLCSNDYGMKHVLGNLTSSNYDSLFYGEEFLKVRNGQQEESLDILCRHCDNFCCDVDLFAKVYNFPYRIDRYVYYLRDLHSINDLKIIMQKGFNEFKKRYKFH